MRKPGLLILMATVSASISAWGSVNSTPQKPSAPMWATCVSSSLTKTRTSASSTAVPWVLTTRPTRVSVSSPLVSVDPLLLGLGHQIQTKKRVFGNPLRAILDPLSFDAAVGRHCLNQEKDGQENQSCQPRRSMSRRPLSSGSSACTAAC